MPVRASRACRRHPGSLLAAACLLAACAGAERRAESRELSARGLRAELEAGLDLYRAGELAPAALRFRDAGEIAGALRAEETLRRATAAECLAWLRARGVAELSECSLRLERLQQRSRHPDPALNTLVALGAVAGGRPLPALRVPGPVRPLIEALAP